MNIILSILDNGDKHRQKESRNDGREIARNLPKLGVEKPTQRFLFLDKVRRLIELGATSHLNSNGTQVLFLLLPE